MAATPRGHIEQLPSGSFRVHVYAGTDPVTGKPRRIRETCPDDATAAATLGCRCAAPLARRLRPGSAFRRPARAHAGPLAAGLIALSSSLSLGQRQFRASFSSPCIVQLAGQCLKAAERGAVASD
jgi:hypothetical protein